MLRTVKESVRRMTNQLQLISGYLELEDYSRALVKTRETMNELHALAESLTGLASARMTVPKDGAVVVPHGSTGGPASFSNLAVGTFCLCSLLHIVRLFCWP